MRITIEPTAEGVGGDYPNSKVSVEYPSDDIDIETVLGSLIEPALQAFGYHLGLGRLEYIKGEK